jgi:hypothetical protein
MRDAILDLRRLLSSKAVVFGRASLQCTQSAALRVGIWKTSATGNRSMVARIPAVTLARSARGRTVSVGGTAAPTSAGTLWSTGRAKCMSGAAVGEGDARVDHVRNEATIRPLASGISSLRLIHVQFADVK